MFSRALSMIVLAAVSGQVLAAEPAAATPAAPAAVARPAPPGPVYGVNLAGAEFGDIPGTAGKTYVYPGAAQLDYLQRKGLLVARVPFAWERLQPALNGALDTAELARLDEVVALARARGVGILLDPHNYARYRKKLKENGIGGTYWAAGPWWGNYPLSVEPRNGQDRPQMAVLLKYAAPGAGGRPGP